MGEVFLAEDQRLKRQVALKRLTGDGTVAPELQRRLLHEARIAAALNHPNVAAIYDVLQTDEGAFIVMEYVPGETLAERLREGRLAPAAVAWIGVQLCEALAEAHSHGIIHRDLKPSNLALTPDGRFKVLDFGVAKTLMLGLSGQDAVTSRGIDLSLGGRRLVGTPPYLAPECILGNPVDERSDLYGAGVVLYELLTGRRPFARTSAGDLADAILHDTPPRPRELNQAISEELERVVLKAMAREPSERYPTAAAMMADLERARGEESTAPTIAAGSPVEIRAGQPRGKGLAWRPLVLVTAAGLAVAILILMLLPHNPPKVARMVRLAVLPCQNIGPAEDDFWADGITEAVIDNVSHFPNVRVISRSAVMRYKNKAVDPRGLASELGVDALLESSLLRGEGRLRIFARLIRANDGFEMWASRYDEPVGDIFTVQDAVAAQIARALHVESNPELFRRNAAAGTRDLRAYELYLQGRYYFYKYDRPGIEQAIELYRLALTRDKSFALAHAGLSLCYSQYSNFMWDADPAWLDRALDSARQALQLAPGEAEVHFALAFAHQQRGELDQALREFETTVSLNPSHAHAHAQIATIQYQSHCRLRRAQEEYAIAIGLDPYLLTALWYRSYLHALSGEPDQAAILLEKARRLSPQSVYTLLFHATAVALSGTATETEQARAEMVAGAPNNPLVRWSSGLIYFFSEEHRKALDEFDTALRLDPGLFPARAARARILFAMKRYDEALVATDEALKPRESAAGECRSCELWFARPVTRALRSATLAALGRTSESQRAFQEFTSELEPRAGSGCVAYQLARGYALAGRSAETLQWLGRATEGGCVAYAVFRVEPDLRGVRSAPLFERLMKSKRGN